MHAFVDHPQMNGFLNDLLTIFRRENETLIAYQHTPLDTAAILSPLVMDFYRFPDVFAPFLVDLAQGYILSGNPLYGEEAFAFADVCIVPTKERYGFSFFGRDAPYYTCRRILSYPAPPEESRRFYQKFLGLHGYVC